MKLNILRKDPKEDPQLNVVIVSAACCVPGMAPLDEQARRIVEQALSEVGVVGRVSIMPATTAFFGGAPREVMARLISDSQSGKISVPAVLIGGKAVSYGVPNLEQIKSALLEAASAKTTSK
ncbi:MAG: hypothetical protein ACYC3S_15220 [Chloroflexota bacterium]